MKPKSDNLFHFTKSLDVLKLILENGIQPRFCLEDIEWFNLDTFKHIAYPMSCFCDIPLSRISEHTDFYGSYGIGLSKEWGVKNNLNPVVYSPPGGHIQNLAKHVFYLEFPDELKKMEEELNPHIYKLLSFIKPTYGKMVVSSGIVEKEFYQENEWRFVPDVDKLIYHEKFEEEKDFENKEIEKYKLKFTPQDIKYIFVREDNDIPPLVDFINEKLGRFPLNDLKILQSRIVSLQTLSLDL